MTRCTTLVPLAIILPTNAASEIMGRQTMLFDKLADFQLDDDKSRAKCCLRVQSAVCIRGYKLCFEYARRNYSNNNFIKLIETENPY